jgi:hypothetical protein
MALASVVERFVDDLREEGIMLCRSICRACTIR